MSPKALAAAARTAGSCSLTTVSVSHLIIFFWPIFATTSKGNPDPVVGLEMIREVRALTDKPIVAIGGITLETAKAVTDAGADSVAVISDILLARSPGERARQFLDALGQTNRAAAV